MPPVAELGLLDFIPAVSPEFARPDHLKPWTDLIEAALFGGVRGLNAVPIRHHKTQTTIHGIAWLLVRDPTLRIIYMVADHEVANDRANRIRSVCEGAAQTAGVDIGPERGQNVKTSWTNRFGGGVQVMSAKQSRLGQDVDILIVDDPISEFDAADSRVRTAVDMAIAHYTARAGRTGGKRGSVLIIMSRWHPDDPIGRRLTRKAEPWSYVHASAIIDAGGPDERAFAPWVMPLDELKRRREELREVDISERLWWAQFQNDPLPDALGLFRASARYDVMPGAPGGTTWHGLDMAYSAALGADKFAIVSGRAWRQSVIEKVDGRARAAIRSIGYVGHVRVGRWDPTAIEDAYWEATGLLPGGECYSYISGPEIGTVRHMAEHGVIVHPLKARYSKRIRAQRAIDLNNAGRLRLPAEAPWVQGFQQRMILFSGDERSTDDDEVDALVSGVDGGMMSGTFVPKSAGSARIAR
jgi:hypothetical protein